MNKSDNKILITGGHATPAFAVLDELIKRKYHNFLWVGEKHNQRGTASTSPEYKTVTETYKIRFINLKAGKLVRKWNKKTFLNGILEFLNLQLGFLQSFFIILKERPNIVMSFGGFLAVPVVFWAKLFRIKIITHEQTIVTGLANKIIAKFADKILVSFESSRSYFKSEKLIFTGNPLRKEIFEIKSDITRDLNKNRPILYITGGNQGANEINKRIFQILDQLLENFNIVHQTGNSTVTNDYVNALELKENLSAEKSKRYIVKDYIGPNEIGEVFNKASIILSRSGANTTLEILAIGKLAILIPIPWSSYDEQTKNAKLVESLGLSKVLIQDDSLTSDTIQKELLNAKKCLDNSIGFTGKDFDLCCLEARKIVILDAAKRVCNVIEEHLN